MNGNVRMGLGATSWHRRRRIREKSSCEEELKTLHKGKLLEAEHRDGTHRLTAFCWHPSSTGSGDPVLEQSSKPTEEMTGKRKARKEEALPRAHARRMQRVIPGTEVAVSMAVSEAQPDLPYHGELKYLSDPPTCEARYACGTQTMGEREKTLPGWMSRGGMGSALA